MSKNNINPWLTYSLLGVMGVMLLGVLVFFYQYQNTDVPVQNNLAINEEKKPDQEIGKAELTEDYVRRTYFPETEAMTIASTTVEASVAISWPDRIKGLSETPYLPEGVVKFFVFDTSGFHSIWMKDMNYAIDIIWVDENNKIVDYRKRATPESFPENFTPEVEAKYVIETNAGFIESNTIALGQEVTLPKF